MNDTQSLTGRELDAAIAERLFGWRWYAFDGHLHPSYVRGIIKARVRRFAPPEVLAGYVATQCTPEEASSFKTIRILWNEARNHPVEKHG